METDDKFRERVEVTTGFSLEEVPHGEVSELRPSMRRVARYLPGGGREYVYERSPEVWRHAQVLDGSDEDNPRGRGDRWTVRFRRPGSDTYESVDVVDFAIMRNDAGWANETWAPSVENGEALTGADAHGVEVTGDKRGLTFLVRRGPRVG
jgi:hypothetical protein